MPGRNNETEPGQRAYNIVWYRPTTPEKLADFCTDASGKSHGTSIPPPLIRPDVIAWSKAQARALVAPQVAEIFERDPRPFFQAIFDFDLAADRVRPRGAARATPRSWRGRIPAPAPPRRDGRRASRRLRSPRSASRPASPNTSASKARSAAASCGRASIDGSYITDQHKPREQRRNKDVIWAVDDLMRDHDGRSVQVQRILDESRRAG